MSGAGARVGRYTQQGLDGWYRAHDSDGEREELSPVCEGKGLFARGSETQQGEACRYEQDYVRNTHFVARISSSLVSRALADQSVSLVLVAGW